MFSNAVLQGLLFSDIIFELDPGINVEVNLRQRLYLRHHLSLIKHHLYQVDQSVSVLRKQNQNEIFLVFVIIVVIQTSNGK